MPERTQTLHTPPTLYDLVDTVGCPTCHVGTGAHCVTRANKPAREPHGQRFDALEQAAGITEHRATARREAEARGGWVACLDSKAEQALLSAYAARITQTSDRTHPTQQDEALRQVRAPLSTRELRTRAGLRWIADRFTGFRSSEDMTGVARTSAALRYSTDILGDTRDANGLYYDLLQALPIVDRDMTRGEYALIVRRELGGQA